MRSLNMIAAAVAVAALLVACGNESGTEGQPMPSTGSSNTPTPDPSTPPPTAGPAGGPVEQAKADLVKRLGVEPGQVTVVSSEEVTWQDGSLGCPEPGMRYTQALVNGSRIILEAGGTQYHYHSGGTRPPFFCANPSR
ncbi:hypothetical protein ACWCOV_24985 [Kribbella sp. NPDC002412]